MHPLVWIFIILLLSVFFLMRKKGDMKTPPGPFELPMFGSLLSFGGLPHRLYAKWAKKHGPIVQAHLGYVRLIILSDIGMLKEAFHNPIFTGRPKLEMFRIVSDDYRGIIGSDGALWEEQRRFTLRHLRDFGFGKNTMESLIKSEIENFLDWLDVDTPINLNRKFAIAVVNSLWTITTSEKLDYDDPKLLEIVKKTKLEGFDPAKFGLKIFLPTLSKLIPFMPTWDDFKDVFNTVRAFVEKPIQSHKETFQENSEPRDFIDAYLHQMRKAEKGSSFHKEEGERNLNATVLDIFFAGSFTTSNALTWSFLYLIKNLDIQQKMQEEVDTVVGKSRKPALADRINMPYTEAFIYEILRDTSFVPAGVFHTAMTDTEFRGYAIPKGTLIVQNTHYIHHDPKLWGDPDNFRPSRFLTPDGKCIDTEKTANMIVFSMGKRTCLGQPLAMTQLFLFLSSLLQRFNFRAVPGEKLSIQPTYNLDMLEPHQYQVIVTERES